MLVNGDRTTAITCTTDGCENDVDPNGFVRLNECDCLGEPDIFPNCKGHTYCARCVELLERFGDFAGCVHCSSSATLVAHGGACPAATCPECEATIPPCDHFPWCPTLEVNQLASTIQILSGYIDRDALDDDDRAFVDRLTDPRRFGSSHSGS